jgi:phosphate transport system permease protein
MRVRAEDRVFTAVIGVMALLLVGLFIALMGDLVWRGHAHLSWGFLIDEPLKAGRQGGIGPILISTLLLLLVALVVTIPLGLGVAVWLSEYNHRGSLMARNVRLSLDVLAGVPSIIFGLFGNAFFCVFLGMGYSILAGGLTLTCMILPIFIRTAEAGLSGVNHQWRLAAAALGMSRASLVWHVLLPSAATAITAGLVLGIGRATAETAAVIFTSGYVDRQPQSLFDSGRSLAVHIYDLSMNVSGGDAAAYASALVLIFLVVLINAGASALSARWLGRRVNP